MSRPATDADATLGGLVVICGPMFSGKSTMLLDRLARIEAGGRSVLLCTPARDTRYGVGEVVTHEGRRRSARALNSPSELIGERAGVVGVDEAHFFGSELIVPVLALVARGAWVLVAGVERDHKGEPFEPFPRLLCEADEVVKLSGPCARCGRPAVHSQRLFESDEPIVVGGAGAYEARCRACFGRC